MAQWYLEVRSGAAKGADSIAADTMRHLHTRQHLGKAVVVSEQSIGMLSAGRKQWLKLSRSLQKERAATLNADKILKYTHSITRMQHMAFSAKSPLESPEASVYFLRPGELQVVPVMCYSLYILTPVSDEQLRAAMVQLPPDGLVIDYSGSVSKGALGMLPKTALESSVRMVWQQVKGFLDDHHIEVRKLVHNGIRNVEAMDNALDTLLGRSHQFLRLADEFQRALELARPLELLKERRESYDSLILLAHRVQALSPGAFSHHFLETFNEDDTFFLYDHGRKQFKGTGETLAVAYTRHMAAGRNNLAIALLRAFGRSSPG